MAVRKMATQVTEPVVKIQHTKNSYTAIYILRDKTQKFRMPGVKDDSPRAWDYGPSLIVEEIRPQMTHTVIYDPDNKKIWEWLGALLKIGVHVINHDELKMQIPKELKEYWNH